MYLGRNEGIIEDAGLLNTGTIPHRIIGRDEQVEKLKRCLAPIEKGLRPVSAWLYGSPGTGKTMIARKLSQQVSNSQNRVSLYVNCWERPTLYSVLQALCEQLKILGADAHNPHIKLNRIKRQLKGKSVLIILDEIDRPLSKERGNIIYELLQIPQVGLFCITTSSTAFINLDDRVKSKLSPMHVRFSRYSADRIRVILEDRATLALSSGTCTTPVLNKIAELPGGDAASAIKLLLRSALDAEKRGAKKITVEDIPEDITCWKQIERKARLQSLNRHQRLVYDIIKREGQIHSSVLRQFYLQDCHKKQIKPVSQRTVTNYIKGG